MKHLTNILGTSINKEFIFIGSDAVSSRYGTIYRGSFTVDFPFKEQPYFTNHITEMTPQTSSDNPWFMKWWNDHYNCSAESSTLLGHCDGLMNMTLPDQKPQISVGTTIDSVNTVVYGLHNLIMEKCPTAFVNTTLLKDCITGEDLLNSIKRVAFDGTSWRITFDEQGRSYNEKIS